MCPAHNGQGSPHPFFQRGILAPASTVEYLLGDPLTGAIAVIGDTTGKAEIFALSEYTARIFGTEVRANFPGCFVDAERF